VIYKSLFIFFIVFLFLGCSQSEKQKASVDLDLILPGNLDNFKRVSRIKIYPADSLVSYIGEVANEYISYGVVRVAGCQYKSGNQIYSADLYEFDDPLGAFGIYSKRRLPEDKFIEIGTESLLGSGFIYYFKDRFFVTINSYSDGLPDIESLFQLATMIDSLIPGNSLYPEQIMIFPQKRLVRHSEKFLPHGFESFNVPDSCFSAVYKRKNATCTLFYSLNRDEIEYETFVKILQKRGRILTHTAGVGRRSIYSVSEKDGKVLMGYSDRVIFGVMGVSGDYWAKALCEALFENLGKTL